jgi:hypothetical protein
MPTCFSVFELELEEFGGVVGFGWLCAVTILNTNATIIKDK